jgi:pSer/pThr/pTyr-binding forkhead associated (FHA) protein
MSSPLPASPPAYGRLFVQTGLGPERVYTLSKSHVLIGRATTNDVVLLDTHASRYHALVNNGPLGCTVEDLGSADGTQLNGRRVTQADLSPGDTVEIGGSRLRFVPPLPSDDDDDPDVPGLAEQALGVKLTEIEQPRLVVRSMGGTQEYLLSDDEITLGGDPTNDIVLADPLASPLHAKLVRFGSGYKIEDQDSAEGTWVGDASIRQAILSSGQPVHIGGTELLYKPPVQWPTDSARSHLAERPPVIIVPGIMGTELWLGKDDLLWPDIRDLVRRVELLSWPGRDDIRPGGLIKNMVIVPGLYKMEIYGLLTEYLVDELGYIPGEDLIEFGYDWRQDVRRTAEQLRDLIDVWPAARERRVVLIAHSLGTFVARTYVQMLGGDQRVRRLVLMGAPATGSPKGLLSFLAGPQLLPFGFLGERLRNVLLTFPSAYQVLPDPGFIHDERGQPVDLFEDERWLPPEFRPLLHSAAVFRRELSQRPIVPTVCIFGYGLKTLTRIQVERDAAGMIRDMAFTHEPAGDETVPERAAIIPGAEIHPVRQSHGALYVDSDVQMRLQLELARD